MSEDGSKGLSLPKGGKSALKSSKGGKSALKSSKGGKSALKSFLPREEPLKWKDEGTAKSKRGRKVQFGTEEATNVLDSPNGGKTYNSSIKGDRGKGEKGGKTTNSGKSSMPPPLELKVEPELPKNCKCLMDCEAAHVLQGIEEQMVILSEDPTIKLPPGFDKALQYAKTGSHYTGPHPVRSILGSLKRHGVTDSEICVIANICPETPDEVFALIPSLKDKQSELRGPLKEVLSSLATVKQST